MWAAQGPMFRPGPAIQSATDCFEAGQRLRCPRHGGQRTSVSLVRTFEFCNQRRHRTTSHGHRHRQSAKHLTYLLRGCRAAKAGRFYGLQYRTRRLLCSLTIWAMLTRVAGRGFQDGFHRATTFRYRMPQRRTHPLIDRSEVGRTRGTDESDFNRRAH